MELFLAALARRGRPPARIVPWRDLIAGRVALPEVVPEGGIVRLESPGRDFATEQALLAAGTTAASAESYTWMPPEAVSALEFDRGRMLCPRQWYLGFRGALAAVEEQLARCPRHVRMNHPAEVALMFDKAACHARLQAAGLPVPRSLGEVSGYEALRERMRATGCPRVFVKLAHGSSAAGAVAYQVSGERHHATTTVECVRSEGELRLYNTRRMRVLRERASIAEVIDALCRHRVHVEQWIPKAGLAGCACDLRVVVIAGQARHTVVRLSRSPMTNLHLLNVRGDVEALRARMGEAAWEEARWTCERVMGVFPGSLYAGIDLLVAPGYRRHAVLEVNAFGDLLPGLDWGGVDTYGAEIAAMVSHDQRA